MAHGGDAAHVGRTLGGIMASEEMGAALHLLTLNLLPQTQTQPYPEPEP